jgi:hypothetical protein
MSQYYSGRAVIQAVSRQLHTAAAQLRAQVSSHEICEQSGTGAHFLRVLRFPLPILIPPTAPHSSSIIRVRYSRPNSGSSTKWTRSQPTPTNKQKLTQALSYRLPLSFLGQIIWDFWWTKWHWGRFSLSTSVSPDNFHSTTVSIFTNDPIIDAIVSMLTALSNLTLFSHILLGLSVFEEAVP